MFFTHKKQYWKKSHTMVHRVEKEELSPLQKKKKKSFIPYTKCRSFTGLVLIERTKQNKTKQTQTNKQNLQLPYALRCWVSLSTVMFPHAKLSGDFCSRRGKIKQSNETNLETKRKPTNKKTAKQSFFLSDYLYWTKQIYQKQRHRKPSSFLVSLPVPCPLPLTYQRLLGAKRLAVWNSDGWKRYLKADYVPF